MRHWSALATRNWRVKRVRTAGAVLAIALGTGAVVWVTCCYESVRQAILQWSDDYIGAAHITVESPLGKYDTLPQRLVGRIEQLPGVAHVAPVLVQRTAALAVTRKEWEAGQADGRSWAPSMYDLDVHGIDIERERHIRDWAKHLIAGQMLTEDDANTCVLEASVAEEEGVGVGDMLLVWGTSMGRPTPLTIKGLIERRRIARVSKGVALVRLPVLQQICEKPVLVNDISVVLEDPTLKNMRRIAVQIRAVMRGQNVMVRSAEARLQRIQMALDQQQMVLVLLSCVAMLTALFIILSTLSMGLLERIKQFGLLRSVGATGRQLVALTLAEAVPLGVLGVALGVPIGFGLTAITVQLVPQYVGKFAVGVNGIALAVGAGLVTTLIGALLPALAAATVSPLEALHPRARRAGFAWVVLALLAAGVALIGQMYIVEYRIQRDLDFVQWSVVSVVLLYGVYALAAPLLVWVASRVAVPITSLLVGVRLRLLQDQVGYAVWRSAGIVCGLMVGLSLIVGLIVFSKSFRSGWQFPKQFPEAYVWSYEQINVDVPAALADVSGIKQFTTGNAVNAIVEERPLFMERLLKSITWFLGIEPDSFLDMVKLEFVDGDEQTARRMLKQGGYVLVSADFARTRHKAFTPGVDASGNPLDNTVRVYFNNHWTVFKIAGVIDSPALDIAASYFQVESEAMVAAAGSVIGTNEDMKRLWNVDGYKLVLLNFDLPPAPPPANWPPPEGSPEAALLDHKLYDTSIPLEQRWSNYRERQVLNKVLSRLHAPWAFYGTARELKEEIDRQLTDLTYLLTAVPAVALLVAALGVANLMTANVSSRSKQLAILRAVGATRGLVLRMVIGEALVLGLLGSVMGLALGLHLAWNISTMTIRMWGYNIPFSVPWLIVGVAVALTVSLCILAGIAPARHASRTNVIDALHVP